MGSEETGIWVVESPPRSSAKGRDLEGPEGPMGYGGRWFCLLTFIFKAEESRTCFNVGMEGAREPGEEEEAQVRCDE